MMEVTRVDSYIKHGCHFSGKLAVISYMDELERDPNFGEFGSESIFDYSEKAQAIAKERYPGCKILIAVPDVVVRIE